MAISRSKRFNSGVEKRETMFQDPLLRPDMAAWIYPRTKGDKLYGRDDNLGDRHSRLHYGFGDGPDRPWRADETRLDSNPTNERATEEKERSGITTTGLWFAGPASGASFVRTSEVIDRSGNDGNEG